MKRGHCQSDLDLDGPLLHILFMLLTCCAHFSPCKLQTSWDVLQCQTMPMCLFNTLCILCITFCFICENCTVPQALFLDFEINCLMVCRFGFFFALNFISRLITVKHPVQGWVQNKAFVHQPYTQLKWCTARCYSHS